MFSVPAAIRRKASNAPFISVWRILEGDLTYDITFGAESTSNNFHIDWGDGTEEDITGTINPVHTYATFGDYTVTASGLCPKFKTSTGLGETSGNSKLLKVLNLGSLGWVEVSFRLCRRLESFVSGDCDTSGVSYLKEFLARDTQSPATLISADVSSMSFAASPSISDFFLSQDKLITVNISGWGTNTIGGFGSIFAGCTDLISVSIAHFNMENMESDTANGYMWMFGVNRANLSFCPWNAADYSAALIAFAAQDVNPMNYEHGAGNTVYWPGGDDDAGQAHPVQYYASAAAARSTLISKGWKIWDSGEIPDP